MPLNIKPMITRYAPIDTEESTTNDSAVTSHKNATVCFTLRTVFIYHVVWLLIATAVVVSTGTWPQFSNYPTCFPFRKEDFGSFEYLSNYRALNLTHRTIHSPCEEFNSCSRHCVHRSCNIQQNRVSTPHLSRRHTIVCGRSQSGSRSEMGRTAR